MLLKFLGKYRDAGLLILRIGLGIMFCLHGLPKLHGGPAAWKALGHAMGVLGIHFFPVVWGFMAAVTECIGGILLILGFAYRPVCLLLTFTMIVASLKAHHDKADFQTNASRPIEMACVFFAMAFVGPGRFSIDKD
jgi:putative oxidoreductase